MRCRFALVTILASSLVASPALGWEPPDDGWVRAEPDPAPAALPLMPDLAPFVVPEGIHYVTDTYVRDVVTTEGPLTTYGAETVHRSTGSYARVVDTVESGSASSFDGASFNGRLSLSDGRPVAGTYYENFVLTDIGFSSISFVFFADDAELAQRRATLPPGPPLVTPPPSVKAPRSQPAVTPSAAPTPVPREPVVARPSPGGGVALVPGGPSLTRVEVLRGRRVTLWPRVDGEGVRLLAWRVFGAVGETSTTSGDSALPFITEWERLAPPNEVWTVHFVLSLGVPGEAAPRAITADLAVMVRSPALEW